MQTIIKDAIYKNYKKIRYNYISRIYESSFWKFMQSDSFVCRGVSRKLLFPNHWRE